MATATKSGAPTFTGHTAWIRWSGDREGADLRNITVSLDTPLTLRRGSTLPGTGSNPRHGPEQGVQLSLDDAFRYKQMFDEWGRIVELKERRDWIRTEWIRAKDRGQNPVQRIEAKIQQWCTEDTWRMAAGTLAAGPVAIQGRPYRAPAEGEQVPQDQLDAVEKATLAKPNQLGEQLVEMLAKLVAQAAAGHAGGTP